MIVVPLFKMRFKRLNEIQGPTPLFYQARNVLFNIERITPHISLCPSSVLSSPRPVRIPSLHKASVRVEDGECTGFGPRSEKLGVRCFVQGSSKNRNNIVTIYVECGFNSLKREEGQTYKHNPKFEMQLQSERRTRPSPWLRTLRIGPHVLHSPRSVWLQ